ncbi:hypothetical protein GCM10011518_11260 [Flavobacterium limi]|uniref:Lipoprotein n=1 Tax=Flavobacterium limi TaxID=2045105 RepID=A0ABQ1TWM1_9FLAO|nr:hypothetical protein GCM10011518_11260 [Flavobacterium limi]
MPACSKEKEEATKRLKVERRKKIIKNKELDDFKKFNYFDYNTVMESKYKVLKSGDKIAYSNLVLFYSYNKSKKNEILPYSLLMVEKHKKYDYCTSVFENLLEFYTDKEVGSYYNGNHRSLTGYLKNIELLDKQQRDYLLYFLNVGANHNAIMSVSYLEIIKRNGFDGDKNLKKADSLERVLHSLEKENNLRIF